MKALSRKIGLLCVLMFALCMVVGCSGSKVKLSFETDGGPAVGAVTVTSGEEVELPEPSGNKVVGDEVYVFDGWTADGKDYRGKITAPAESVTYQAKWARGYRVSLDLNGGTYAGETTIYLKEGANVSDALSGITPEKYMPFGAWFTEDNVQVSGTFKMPASELKLIARYTIGYTIDIRLMTLAGTGYVSASEQMVSGQGFAGIETSPEAPNIHGFSFNANSEQNIKSLTLSESENENVFRFCYDRVNYTIAYIDGLPGNADVTGNTESVTSVFGATVKISENGFHANGYRFLGWSDTSDGEVMYHAGESIVLEDTLVLYGVWEKGYSNRLGGNDYIYFPEGEEDVAILERGGAEFYGTRDGNDFLFKETGLRGRVSGNTFVYYNTDLARKYVYVGFNVANDPDRTDEEKLNENITLDIDEYLMATYTERSDGKVVREVKGALTFDALYGDYFLDAGSESMNLTLGTFTSSEGEVEAFSVRGEEGNAADYYYQAIPHGEGAVIGSYAVTFDGYGTFILVDTNYMDTYMGIYYVLGRQVDSEGVIYYEMVGLVSDDWGNMTGIPGNIVKLDFITMQYGDGLDAAYYFIQRDNTEGRYIAADGSVLTLDGYGRLSESAVYEKDGEKYTGSYRYTYSEVFGSKIEATLYPAEGGTSEGRGYVFTLNGESFTAEDALQSEEKLGEYLLFTYDEEADDGRGSPAFATPFTSLVIYDTDFTEGGVTGKSAELWIRNGESAERVARGYITVESLGTGADFMPFACSAFTATEGKGEYRDLTFKFLTNLTTPDGVNYYDVFYILEYNGKARYAEHKEVDAKGNLTGGKLWHMMLNEGMGSLYFDSNGLVYEGSFSYTASDYFGGFEGMFVWIDYANSEYRAIYFMMEDDTSGYTIRHIEEDERERPVYQMVNGVLDPMVYFTVRGSEDLGGEAIYNSNGLDAGSPEKGAFSPIKEQTVLGSTIYQFTVAGRLRWYFVMENYYYAPQDMWIKVYYKASSLDVSKTYSVEGGGTLIVDGFHRARLEAPDGDAYGEYYVDQYESSLGFISDNGTSKTYSIEAGVLTPLDGAYGTWNLYDGIRHFYGEIIFDGRGGCRLYYELANDVRLIQGTYRPIESNEEMTCILTIDIGDGTKDYYAQFRIITLMEIELREVTVRDDDTYGIFRGDDMSVLALDGLGYGTFYDANGNAGDYGYLEMLSEEDDFACFSSYNNYDVTYFLLLDPENKTYSMLDYSKYGQVYYAEDLQGVEFGVDGNASFPFGFGPYFVDEAGAHVFVRDNMSGNYVGHEVPAPTDGDYKYIGKTYFRWDKGTEVVTFKGKITFGNEEPIEATLTVTLDGNPWLDTSAILSATKQEYSGLSFVYLNIGAQDLVSGAYLRDSNMNYFPLKVHYIPDGDSTFEAEGGFQKTVLQDGYEAEAQINGELDHPISTLTTTYKGFGPIVLDEPMIEGILYYQPLMTNNRPFTFTAKANDVTLIGEDYSEGKLYLLPFEKDNVLYAMSYYSNSGRFELYMMMKYTKVEADPYEVGVGSFLYSNRFSFPGIGEGDFCAAVVYKAEGGTIVAYNQFCYPEQNAAWVIDLGTYNQFEGTGTLGKAYWIDVTFEDRKATSAKVTEYTLKQALSADGMYLVNFFLNENGEIEKLAALAVSEGGFVYVRFDSAEGDGNSYVVKDGNNVYTVKIVLDESGERQSGNLDAQGMLVPAENGEFWFITVESA